MAEASYSEGNALFVDEDFDGAIAAYCAAIESGMNTADVFVKRAAAYLKVDKFAEALQDSNAAIGVDANNESAYFRKG
jgi:tetratricopeptide (TPR) repeat protein